jgi:hypothetical protein
MNTLSGFHDIKYEHHATKGHSAAGKSMDNLCGQNGMLFKGRDRRYTQLPLHYKWLFHVRMKISRDSFTITDIYIKIYSLSLHNLQIDNT